MAPIRKCDARCHTAVRKQCNCWCAGFFHGRAGRANREALAEAVGNSPARMAEVLYSGFSFERLAPPKLLDALLDHFDEYGDEE